MAKDPLLLSNSLALFLTKQSKGSIPIKKMSQKGEKVHNFFDPPPSHRMFWTFFNLGKMDNSITPLF